MRALFDLSKAQSYLLLILALHLCPGSAQAQPGVTRKGASGNYAQLVAQVGHEAEIGGLAFSPDGRLLLTSSSDAAVLWEVATGRELRRFLGSPTQLAPFSEDTRFVMTAYEQYTGYGKTFSSGWFTKTTEHLFDTATGREVRFVSGDSKGYWAVVISPDNRLVATADHNNNVVYLWNVETKKQLRRVEAFTKDLNGGIGFTKDGRFLLTTIEEEKDPRVQLWDTATGLEAHRFPGRFLTESKDSRFLVTMKDQVGHLWERATGKEVRSFGPFTGAGSLVGSGEDWTAVFSSDGRLVAVQPGGEYRKEKVVHVYETATGREVGSFAGDYPEFSPDGRLLKTLTGSVYKDAHAASEDFETDTAHIWDLETGQERRQFPATAAQFSPHGRFLIASNHRASYKKPRIPARLLDAGTGEEVIRFDDQDDVQNARFSPDERFLATVDGDQKSARLWDISAKREVRRFEGRYRAGGFEISPDERWVVTTTDREEEVTGPDGESSFESHSSGELWDLNAGQIVQHFEFKGTHVSFSPDSRLLVIEDGDSLLREVATWRELRRFKGGQPIFLPDGRLIATSDDANMYVSEVETGREVWRFKSRKDDNSSDTAGQHFAAFSPGGRYGLATAMSYYVPPDLFDLKTGRALPARSLDEIPTSAVAFAPDGRSFLVSTQSFADGGGGGDLCLHSVPAGARLRCYKGLEYGITAVSLTRDNRFVLASTTGNVTQLWDKTTGRLLRRFVGEDSRLSPDEKYLLTSDQNRAHLWSLADGSELRSFEHSTRVNAVRFMRRGRIALTSSSDSTLRFWDTASGRELCRLVASADGDWVVIAPDGRFDTNNLDEIKGLHWVTSDAPFTTLPLEIFMRQYYEPRLLARVLAGEKFSPLPSLANLNRVQPKVEITEISKPDEQARVSVTVEVARAKSQTQRDEQGKLLETGVYDLRLFRDGQLVGYEPKEGRELKLEGDGTLTIKFDGIRLPRKAGVKSVEFSAYAFNAAQVKSATARKSLDLPDGLRPARARAYIITVGVNAYENDAFDLSFAANDARRLQEVMHRSLLSAGEYEEKDIVQIPLISDYRAGGGEGVAGPNNATKRAFKAVLDLLAGRRVDEPELLNEIPGRDRIEAARPEDLVLISFSSHGYATPNGDFYFITSDTGPGTNKEPTPELLRHAISSEELSLWLRDVDAGEMVMIVDACQSTAAVAAAGFKPGPMDSRGLGQLSYDKGMKILTATQSDSVALESKLIEQGLLTYALVHDGIEAGRADFKPPDKTITLSEWLAYGVNRVPGLYEEVKEGKVQVFGRRAAENEASPVIIRQGRSKEAGSKVLDLVAVQDTKIQQPSLFDFTKRQKDIVLVRR